jgi:hypothetical protein
MVRKLVLATLAMGSLVLGGSMLSGSVQAQGEAKGQENQPQTGGLDAKKLTETVKGFGLEINVLNDKQGEEKFEAKVSHEGFDIPVSFEISPSKRYIWMTAFLGKPATLKAKELLRANASIQPTQFYLNSREELMIGIAMENRDMNPVRLKFGMDKLVDDIVNRSADWQG